MLGIKIVGVAPTAPTITGLTNGDGKVSVAFSDTNPGTSPITSYTVTATDDSNANGTRTATGPSSPIEVSGLINGGTYEFTVTATNAFGTSAPSASSGRLNVGVAPTLPSDPADGTVGKSYSSGFDATGAPPPTVTQVSGPSRPACSCTATARSPATPPKRGATSSPCRRPTTWGPLTTPSRSPSRHEGKAAGRCPIVFWQPGRGFNEVPIRCEGGAGLSRDGGSHRYRNDKWRPKSRVNVRFPPMTARVGADVCVRFRGMSDYG